MTNKKPSWEQRYNQITAQYPQAAQVDWSSVFRSDPDVFARLLGDVLKAEGRGSIPGKRPQLDRAEGAKRLAKIAGEDHATVDFAAAFRALTHSLSVRGAARKTGLSQAMTQRLLAGDVQPSFEIMEKVAAAFRKHPSYFLEYRILKVLVFIDKFLTDSPETATYWYDRIYRGDGA